MYRPICWCASSRRGDPTDLPDCPIFPAQMQPVVAKSQSFRSLLEFWTIVAENDDKTKKIVYQ
jgi:hypothetical protein